MKYLCVTSFSEEGYNNYGHRMIESYVEQWKDIDSVLWVFTDTDLNIAPCVYGDRVQFFAMDLTSKDQLAFEQRHNSPICHGIFGNVYDYRFDAVRFSHKPAALSTAIRICDDSEIEPETLIWLDGDTYFKKPMKESFLQEKFPNWAHVGSFPRNNIHTECGIVMYRISVPNVRAFIRIFWQSYVEDQIFRLPNWDDSSVFDILQAGATKDGFVRTVNLGDELSFETAHPIVNSDWFAYVDHLKGNRKETGVSHDSDIVVKV